jgi:hypothetical protein
MQTSLRSLPWSERWIWTITVSFLRDQELPSLSRPVSVIIQRGTINIIRVLLYYVPRAKTRRQRICSH